MEHLEIGHAAVCHVCFVLSAGCSGVGCAALPCSSAAWRRSYHSHVHPPHEIVGTTVLCISKDGQVVMIADGQITAGSKIIKPNARKLRRLGANGAALGGFAGSTADGITLFERLEGKLEEHPGKTLPSHRMGSLCACFGVLDDRTWTTRAGVRGFLSLLGQ